MNFHSLVSSESLFLVVRRVDASCSIYANRYSCHRLSKTGAFDAVIAIGVLIKGSTMHFEYIADAVSHGLMRVQLDTGVPLIFGVLTCLTDDQALDRAGLGRGVNGKGHSECDTFVLP